MGKEGICPSGGFRFLLQGDTGSGGPKEPPPPPATNRIKHLRASWPPSLPVHCSLTLPSHSITGLPANTPPQRSSLTWGFRCSWPYLNFNKGLIKMFSSLKCTGMEFKWRNDRLCAGSIGWVRDITPGWRGELSDDRSCPTRRGLLSLEELKRWTADLPLGARRGPGWRESWSQREASGRSKGNVSTKALVHREESLRCSYSSEASLAPHTDVFLKAYATLPP